MKLLKLLSQWETQIHKKLTRNPIIAKSIVPLGLLILASEIIWILGPKLTIGTITPLASETKRFYAMLFIFLCWLLKFLLIDIVYTKHFSDQDLNLKKKLKSLEERFNGALAFSKYNITETPWLLFIGPKAAGKTTFLANANVNFILKKQFSSTERQQIKPSQHCDWWVSRNATLIDTPSHYLYDNIEIWKFFLKLIKLRRGKNGLNGILIALPAYELMGKTGEQELNHFLRYLIQRMQIIKNSFNYDIPCQIIITKCDHIPGFKAFFAESSLEEIEQTFGIHLPEDKNRSLMDVFHHQFNVLIKKINQQLLFRLHHERNPLLRPEIKDFPLQLENLKTFMSQFVKKLNAHCPLVINSIYLTSARQTEKETLIIDEIDHQSRSLKLYSNPHATRPYFIKQLLENGLIYKNLGPPFAHSKNEWLNRGAYALSFALILTSCYFLGKDFEVGIKRTYALQKDLTDFHKKMASTLDPLDHLTKTIALLNVLHPQDDHKAYSKLATVLFYYSNKANQKSETLYQNALTTILLPELTYFLEEYLTQPVNKEAEMIYTALTSYLMLADKEKLNPEQFVMNLKKIIPKTISEAETQALIGHLNFLFQKNWPALQLNKKRIDDARQFLNAQPKTQLGFIILKNTNNNDRLLKIELNNNETEALKSHPSMMTYNIKAMFVAKNFMTIITNEVIYAAHAAWSGNWILGHSTIANGETSVFMLAEELKKIYMEHYVSHWEKLLSDINFIKAQNLEQLDENLVKLLRHPSPLIVLLKTVHDNTYFEPISSRSAQLNAISLLATNQPDSHQQLLEIFRGLENVHLYLQPLLNAGNKSRTAFDMLAARMSHSRQSDPLLQLRIIAEKNPEPIRSWLLHVSDFCINSLVKEAAQYIDTSWQTKVIHFYNKEIANRYPFAAANHPDVDIQKFISFFGSTGMLLTYINETLKPFIDMSGSEWRWKTINHTHFSFKEETLRQMQLAIKIHKSFFPKQDDHLAVQFTLQPYEIGKFIKNVTLNINNKSFIDDKDNLKQSHFVTWPTSAFLNTTKVTLTLNNNQIINQYYPGNWGWLKLINQSFESILSKKQMRLNLSMNENTVKYLFSTDAENQTFSSLDLKHFHLPQHLIVDEV